MRLKDKIKQLTEARSVDADRFSIPDAEEYLEQLKQSYAEMGEQLENFMQMFQNSQDLHMRIAKTSSDLPFVSEHIKNANRARRSEECLNNAKSQGHHVKDRLNIAKKLWRTHADLGGQVEQNATEEQPMNRGQRDVNQ